MQSKWFVSYSLIFPFSFYINDDNLQSYVTPFSEYSYKAITYNCHYPVRKSVQSLCYDLQMAKCIPYHHLIVIFPTTNGSTMSLGQPSQIEIKYLAQEQKKTCLLSSGLNSQHWQSNGHESCTFPLNRSMLSLFFFNKREL